MRDMALLLLGNLRAKFSETSFPPFKTYFTQIGHCHQFKTFSSSNFKLSSMFSLQNVCPREKKAVDNLVLFHIIFQS